MLDGLRTPDPAAPEGARAVAVQPDQRTRAARGRSTRAGRAEIRTRRCRTRRPDGRARRRRRPRRRRRRPLARTPPAPGRLPGADGLDDRRHRLGHPLHGHRDGRIHRQDRRQTSSDGLCRGIGSRRQLLHGRLHVRLGVGSSAGRRSSASASAVTAGQHGGVLGGAVLTGLAAAAASPVATAAAAGALGRLAVSAIRVGRPAPRRLADGRSLVPASLAMSRDRRSGRDGRCRRCSRRRLPAPRPPPPLRRFSSTGSVETITPRPRQCSHGSEKTSSRPWPTRLRVIWTRPSEVTSATWCLVRSRPRHSVSRRSTRSRLLSSTMSMKSMTMMPPMSRSRSWRTISSAASMLLRVTVCSRLPPEPTNLPVLTSTTVIASVRSITSEPPDGSQTLRSSAFASCSSMRRLWKTSPSPVNRVSRPVSSGETCAT